MSSTTPGSAIILMRSELVARMRQHFEADDSIAVFDASEVIPSFAVVAAKAQMLLVVGHLFAELPAGFEFLERFREVNATAEIRVLSSDAAGTPLVLHQPVTRPAHLGLRSTSQPLRRMPARRAPRTEMPPDAAILVNGVPVRLVNLSPLGAQVLSPYVLRPGEQIHVRLPERTRVRATVVWSTFELSGAQRAPLYRAGLEFAGR
ncbi:MAG TPA: hypothetical protein VK886_05920 [Vicinamibacterales bacterium]|nr:hypothetical protein [Vicinamibacterales bacterium]